MGACCVSTNGIKDKKKGRQGKLEGANEPEKAPKPIQRSSLKDIGPGESTQVEEIEVVEEV